MGFFKDFKEDFSQAVSELGEFGEVDKEKGKEESDNLLDLEEIQELEIQDAATLEEELEKELASEDELMKGFDDANVDKDLLSQIFAEDGDLDSLDKGFESGNLFGEELAKELEEELENAMPEEDKSQKEVEDIQEEDQEETLENLEVSDEIEDLDGESITQVEEEVLLEEEKNQNIEEINMEANNTQENFTTEQLENDVVRMEACKEMDEERVQGTVTVITQGTTIKGGISSDGSLEVMGVITGDVDCLGKLSIIGKVSGDVSAAEIYANTPRLVGSLTSEGTVKIGVGTVIIGDIIGSSAYIAGAVKGDIDVNGPVIVESTAIVKGNIKAKSIQVNNGAVVDGYCSLNYAGVNLEDFFEEK